MHEVKPMKNLNGATKATVSPVPTTKANPTVGSPFIQKRTNRSNEQPEYFIVQAYKDGTCKDIKKFTDKTTGESDAFNWIRNNTNAWAPRF